MGNGRLKCIRSNQVTEKITCDQQDIHPLLFTDAGDSLDLALQVGRAIKVFQSIP
jgi:hypothetical protein